MLEEAEHLQLAEDPLTGDEVLEDVGHLFEGHTFTVPGVGHRPEAEERSRRQNGEKPRAEETQLFESENGLCCSLQPCLMFAFYYRLV